MKKMDILSVEEPQIAVRRSQYPEDNRAEFLLVGRSNVGKSSLVNALLNEEKAIVSNIIKNLPTLLLFFVDALGITNIMQGIIITNMTYFSIPKKIILAIVYSLKLLRK